MPKGKPKGDYPWKKETTESRDAKAALARRGAPIARKLLRRVLEIIGETPNAFSNRITRDSGMTIAEQSISAIIKGTAQSPPAYATLLRVGAYIPYPGSDPSECKHLTPVDLYAVFVGDFPIDEAWINSPEFELGVLNLKNKNEAMSKTDANGTGKKPVAVERFIELVRRQIKIRKFGEEGFAKHVGLELEVLLAILDGDEEAINSDTKGLIRPHLYNPDTNDPFGSFREMEEWLNRPQ